MRRWLFPMLFGLVAAAFAWQAALVAAPRVVMDIAVRRLAGAGGLNHMLHAPLRGPGRDTVVRPSPDLAYSSCPFDLSNGPLLIEIPPVPAPYWSLSVFDRRTDVVFVRNNRDSKNGPIRIVLARPGQKVPPGAESVRLAGNRGVALLRILVTDRGRFAPLDEARRAGSCRPMPPVPVVPPAKALAKPA
ncbi:MAG: hypothetical protein QOJ27_2772 [Sphingomonadales bacterium]|nr:hypothetical protein [Sphingomonadales bacterium]